MQQLKIEHKKILTSKSQKTEQRESKIEIENSREVKGVRLATSRNILRIQNSDTFYVQSEKGDNTYYFVRYNPSVFEWCSCPDNSIRGQKCKHLFAIEFAIKWGTIKDIDKIPLLEIKERIPTLVVQQPNNKKSYLEDDYDF
jgi:predicted nucleic acid-binding Zn finger protein